MAWTHTLDGRSYHLKTGAVIPALGLGTGGGMSRLDTKTAVLHALHAGYRHLDCSPIYGNEVQVGEALAEAFQSGLCPRADVFVTSKLPSTAHEPADAMAAVLQSLRLVEIAFVHRCLDMEDAERLSREVLLFC